ncbi:dimethylarginine dimethylaminohydrolase family protein [Roseovarius sp. Pro17]|uniref:dimethylarginine dimethylaminohydrolase family protein n=1 Tax=Roseovarius sp. Pro17 TaxID=3108175 RepID=UPI002D79025A|nr:arginine deiminase family protein [Roseovarius sp. Pro17]
MTSPATHFNHAISRRPAASVTGGLRAEDRGAPDLARMQAAHDAYIATLRATGAKVVVLEALEDYPDALFVEDTALCLPEGAIMMRPGADSRMGEVAQMRPTLAGLFDDLRDISGPGHIEGGDILFTGREVLVGRSARTDAEGVAELRIILEEWGHSLRELQTPEGVLHFKTDCSLLDPETVLSTKLLDNGYCFDGYRVLHLPEGEEAAANAIRFNDVVLLPDGFPKTADMLTREGYDIRPIDNTDCALLDGGMSCLSLRFNV